MHLQRGAVTIWQMYKHESTGVKRSCTPSYFQSNRTSCVFSLPAFFQPTKLGATSRHQNTRATLLLCWSRICWSSPLSLQSNVVLLHELLELLLLLLVCLGELRHHRLDL